MKSKEFKQKMMKDANWSVPDRDIFEAIFLNRGGDE
jgi:hypothetical protein